MIEVPRDWKMSAQGPRRVGVLAGTSPPSIMTTKAAENKGPQQSIWRSKER